MTDPKKPGRKPLPDSERLVVVPVRMTLAQKAKFQAMPNGPQRLRDWLDRVK
jgi:hypothetical protein